MFSVSNWNCQTSSYFFEIMKMVQEIGMREINFMDMACTYWDHLTGNARKTMIMSIRALFGQFSAAFKFMQVRLFNASRPF
jgi:hypothetical protein